MASATLAVATAFNLICSGSIALDGKFKEAIPIKRVIRIDTNAMRWCQDACPETSSIKKITPTLIIFSVEDSDGIGNLHFVNRESGNYVDRWVLIAGEKPFTLFTGTCKPAPFTGFPQSKF